MSERSGGSPDLRFMHGRAAEEDATLEHLRSAGTADRRGGTGDEPPEPRPRFAERVGDRTGAHVPGSSCQAVDQFSAHPRLFELHAGEADNPGAGLMGHDEIDIAAAEAGCGEAGCAGSMPAVMNALCEALGVAHIDMPATPEVVWRALQAKAG